MKVFFVFLILLIYQSTWAAKLEVKSCETSPNTAWTEFKTKCGTVFMGRVTCMLPTGFIYFDTVVCEKKKDEKSPDPKACYDEFKDKSKTYSLPSPKPMHTVLGTAG